MSQDHDPGDEHRDRGHQLHLLWPTRDAQFRHNSDADQLGRIVRCGQFVPIHWSTNVGVIVDCDECRK